MNIPFTTYKNFMIKHHGYPLYRIPIDFNFGCPNRELDGSGGCTFCNIRGSAAVQTIGAENVKEQMEIAIKFAKRRYNAKKFMAYVQAYSATFGESQQNLYLDLINEFSFSAVSIGTRPDCITPQAIKFLSELNKEIEVWVELGVQTIHDKTLNRINRGHNWQSSLNAIKSLNENNIPIALHAIIGLPGENKEHYIATARAFSSLPIQAVKIHNLHIEKGTTLALEHSISPINVLDEHEYAECVIDFIRRMPPELPIMRFTTDTQENELIAPKWNMDKQKFKNYLINQMVYNEYQQGDLFNEANIKVKPKDIDLKKIKTNDNSYTFWNSEYKEHYHSTRGANLEAKNKYVLTSKLDSFDCKNQIRVLDICFGIGYNSLCTINEIIKNKQTVSITGLEIDKRILRHASELKFNNNRNLFNWNKTLKNLYEKKIDRLNDNVEISILLGDARQSIKKLFNKKYDLIFLDPFSSQKNSELWTLDFFKLVKRVMHNNSKLITYSSSGPVRSGMISAGLNIGKILNNSNLKEGTIACINPKYIDFPLTTGEIDKIFLSTKKIPYRDPLLIRTNKEILRAREKELVKLKHNKKIFTS